jgi:hypothetical protein
MAPYLEMAKELRVAFVAEVHVLRDLSPKAHPLTAVPAGLANVSKAVYLFGDHPDFGADPNLRVLANTGKFNFGKQPSSLEFEFEIRTVPVLDEESGQAVMEEFGCWVQRGESRVTAKQLLVTLAPETKERKSDRVAHFLLDFLNGRDWVPLLEIKNAVLDLDPPVSWRTVQRLVENEMVGQIEVKRDDTDARKLWWRLSDETQGAFEELTEPDDEIVTEEVDVPEVPDTVPEEWGDEKDDGTDG